MTPSRIPEEVVPAPAVENRIWIIRGQKVILDQDLAELYGVPTSRLNEAVKRNRKRFPADFLFPLSKTEWESLTSQIAIANAGGRGGRRTLPYAFTEQGVAMLSSVLNSERAILVNIAIMRAFVRLRQFLASHEELAQRLSEIERRQLEQDQHRQKQDERIEAVFTTIEQMLAPVEGPKRRFGFPTDEEQTKEQE